MKVNAEKFTAFCWAFPLSCIGLWLISYAVGGDQQFYRAFYENVQGLSLADAFYAYKNQLGTSEPGYFFLVYLVSGWLSKDVAFSIINFILYYQLFLWMLRQNVSQLLFPLLVSNFYLLVLSFSAERLKLSLVIFLVAYSLRGVVKYALLGFSLISHVQVILLLIGTQVEAALHVLRRLMRGRVGLGFLSLLLTVVCVAALLLLLREHIESKLSYYYGAWGGPAAVIKPLVFMVMAIFYSRGRGAEALLASLPMVLASFFIGSERVVIFSYFVFMYYAAPYRRGLNVGVLASALFFAYNGINFLMRMIEFGDGFAGIY